MTEAGTKDHPITISPIEGRERVIWRGRSSASDRALELREAGYPPVPYIPREDAGWIFSRAPSASPPAPSRATPIISRSRDGHDRDDNAVWT